jgi:predicted MPP superfamily phosphohydrolase
VALKGRGARAAVAVAVAAALGLLWAGWIEPCHLLLVDRLPLPVLAGASGGFRLVHLSDLHVRQGGPQASALERLAAEVAAAHPDLIVVSGDWWQDEAGAAAVAANVEAAGRYAARLRRIAPLVAVQGHGDHLGTGVARLRAAGVEWLFNESRRVATPAGPFLLAGLSQQAGHDELVEPYAPPGPRFALYPVPGEPGATAVGATSRERPRNAYLHFDPGPAPGEALAAAGGPLAWSGYDAVADVWLSDEETGAGLVVHSRRPLGEDRLLRLRRVGPGGGGEDGSFVLVAHGTAFTAGDPDTGVVPEPRRWYRLRLATRVGPRGLRVAARVWPADGVEPEAWQAWAEDRSAGRPAAGTVGLWAWGGGTVLYRHLRVSAAGEGDLLDPRLAAAPRATDPGGAPLPGWRAAARGSRLALALAKAPPVPPGTPVIALAHSPDSAPEAAWLGVEAVLAGHTHGGQIALPVLGPLTTRSALGRHYDAGVFHFAAFNPRGWTTLYVNPGVGTTFVPLRFAAPPHWAIVDLGPRRWR